MPRRFVVRRLVGGLSLLVVVGVAFGCSPIPRKYLRAAAPNVTLAKLSAAPEVYRDRLVVMGAVILEEEAKDGNLWLHVKNRPLDQDYRPQLPPRVDDPEAGWYWVVVSNHQSFPASYRHWADITVVGRANGLGPGKEPVLMMVYVRGWGLKSGQGGVWENLTDANYTPFVPEEVIGEGSR
ncbi:MAG: Slp family lipoprotein [Nitrospira sp.]|nr:Slp family lipoprotein [Nitrospira sp.]